MSWPDDHTRYRADGREIADGPRYRLCGNGVVSNVVAWIGRRLMASP
jgi:site-specific DNA-cytosine methylase